MSVHYGDHYFPGTVILAGLTLPGSSVTDASVAAGANIDSTKLERRIGLTYNQTFTDDVVPDRRVVHVVTGTTGSIVSFAAGAVDPAGAASSCTVNLKVNGVSVLSAPITLNNTQVAFELEAGAISDDDLVADDVIEVQVASVTGSNLPVGVFAHLVVDELPQ